MAGWTRLAKSSIRSWNASEPTTTGRKESSTLLVQALLRFASASGADKSSTAVRVAPAFHSLPPALLSIRAAKSHRLREIVALQKGVDLIDARSGLRAG